MLNSHNKAGLICRLSRGSSPAVGLHWSVCLALFGLPTDFFLCSGSSWMPISEFISDWPLVLLCGACYVILACTAVLDRGLSVQAWPVERGRWERESQWERVNAWKELRVDFCSEPVHWRMASNAACLPMAQLFANLSPLSPSSTDWPSVHPPAHPHPLSLAGKKKKQERSNLALSFLLPRPTSTM